jgi:hypothetical protein
MTINRGWIDIFKQISRRSFTRYVPNEYQVETVFIDGQLKLQRPGDINTWQKWLQIQFTSNIRRYIDNGVKTIVLAFDDHNYSPAAKAPTQQKRKSRVVAIDWHERAPLPPTIPAEYERLLFNRTFKRSVISFVIEKVSETMQPLLGDGQRIIIDYRGDPVVLSSGSIEDSTIPMGVALGESDVKFVRYLRMGTLVIDAVDSDYVIIAMNQVEKMQNSASTGGCAPPPDIFVRRILIELEDEKRAGLKKRKQEAVDAGVDGSVPQQLRRGREYEHVHINSLTHAMQSKLREVDAKAQGMNRGLQPLVNDVTLLPNTIRVLSYLVALCGCDFTRGIPWFGPKTLWKNIDLIWWGMRRALLDERRSGANALCPRAVAEYVVCPMWTNVLYKKHADARTPQFQVAGNASFETTLQQLKGAASLSARVRESLVSENELACLVKNCNWVGIYWRHPEQCPDSVDARFGFMRNSKGLVRFDAAAALDDTYF